MNTLFIRKKMTRSVISKGIGYFILFTTLIVLLNTGLEVHYTQKILNDVLTTENLTSTETAILSSGALANLRNFSFLKVSPKCNDDVFLVLIVPSHPRNRETREVLRSSYNRRIYNKTCKVVFLYGKQDDPTMAMDVEQEVHHDLVQGNFEDSYKSIAYNHLQGLKWATSYCPQAKYVAKADDDVFVNLYKLVWDLTEKSIDQNALFCADYYGGPVFRDKNSKYYVPKEQFAEETYPKYCSGWLVVYGQSAAKQVLEQASLSKFLWMSDAFITGVVVRDLKAKKSPLHTISMGKEFTFNDKQLEAWLKKGTVMPEYYSASAVNDWRLLRAIQRKIDKLASKQSYRT